ncbi:MAG: DUF1292 domain-containing protein [Clostridia bacterium]|nr:DUF1292 domain-containing protein [Clostridia bacterium]
MSDQDFGTITFEAEDGEELELHVLDYFFYNGAEYAVLADRICGEDCENSGTPECDDCDVGIYYMHVENTDDEETFTPIDDEALLEALDDAYHAGEDEEY